MLTRTKKIPRCRPLGAARRRFAQPRLLLMAATGWRELSGEHWTAHIRCTNLVGNCAVNLPRLCDKRTVSMPSPCTGQLLDHAAGMTDVRLLGRRSAIICEAC